MPRGEGGHLNTSVVYMRNQRNNNRKTNKQQQQKGCFMKLKVIVENRSQLGPREKKTYLFSRKRVSFEFYKRCFGSFSKPLSFSHNVFPNQIQGVKLSAKTTQKFCLR